MSQASASSPSRRASSTVSAVKADQRPGPVKRLSSSSDGYGTDRSYTENHWSNEDSRKRARNPPAGAQGVIIKLPCDDERLNGKELHGYIANGMFKGRIPDAGIKHRSKFQGILKRSASGQHDTIIDGHARKALSWPDSLGGFVGEPYTKVWGPVTVVPVNRLNDKNKTEMPNA